MEWFVFNYFTIDRGISVLEHAFAFAVVVLTVSNVVQELVKLKRKHYKDA